MKMLCLTISVIGILLGLDTVIQLVGGIVTLATTGHDTSLSYEIDIQTVTVFSLVSAAVMAVFFLSLSALLILYRKSFDKADARAPYP